MQIKKDNKFSSTLADMGVITMTASKSDPDRFDIGFTPVFVFLLVVVAALGVTIYLFASSIGETRAVEAVKEELEGVKKDTREAKKEAKEATDASRQAVEKVDEIEKEHK